MLFAHCGNDHLINIHKKLTDFDEYGGVAANSRLTTRLADFGNLTLSGNLSTIGFGSIEKKVNERQKYNAYQYDFSSTFNLDISNSSP